MRRIRSNEKPKYSFDSKSLWMTYICNRRNDKKYGLYEFVFNGQNLSGAVMFGY